MKVSSDGSVQEGYPMQTLHLSFPVFFCISPPCFLQSFSDDGSWQPCTCIYLYFRTHTNIQLAHFYYTISPHSVFSPTVTLLSMFFVKNNNN